jgi:ribosomal protein S18 acetylase RimI-like enzyme
MHSSAGWPPDGAPEGVTLRAARPTDVTAVAQLHVEAIAEGFLSRLGTKFLRRLYRRILREPGSFLIVADDDGAVAGFVAGSVSLSRLYRSFVVRDGIQAVLDSLGPVLSSLPRVLETLRRGGAHAGGDGGPGEDGAAAELLSIAVGPSWRGRGVARSLVRAFQAELERRGVSTARVVLGADNAAAAALYRGSGFHRAHTFELHRGTTSVLMTWVLDRRGTSPPGPQS